MSAAAVALLALAAAVGDPIGRIERTVFLMGTEARLAIEASSKSAAVAASESAIQALANAEQRLSTWRPDAELARLNRVPAGERLEISPRLAADLRAAEACWRETGGAFDPTVGALVRAWGLRDGGRQPSQREIARALRATGMDGVRWVGDAVVERIPDLLFEEGGFGKGAGLDDALAVLESDPSVARAVLDLGGQVAVSGTGTSWTLTLADPSDRRRAVLEMTIDRGSVATSGNSERGLRLAGRPASHLLDPRTGRPAADFGTLTVWTRNALWADCLSTGLYAEGPDAAIAWARSRPDVEILILEHGTGGIRARATPGLRNRLRPLIPDVTIEVAVSGSSQSSTGSSTRPSNNEGWRDRWQGEPGPPTLQ